jgi:hypothetical protein
MSGAQAARELGNRFRATRTGPTRGRIEEKVAALDAGDRERLAVSLARLRDVLRATA